MVKRSPRREPPTGTSISGTFELFFNATGNDVQGQQDPTVGGGTQSDLLTVNYNEVAGYNADGVEIAGPAVAAQQIQTWLNAFAPQPANAATGFAGSDATHATVNATDAHTFVLDYGQATEGLDQSALLQYIPTGETAATQTLTFNSTAGATQIINPLLNPAFPITQPNDVGAGNIGLQVGSVNVTVAMDFDDPGTTAAAIQGALHPLLPRRHRNRNGHYRGSADRTVSTIQRHRHVYRQLSDRRAGNPIRPRSAVSLVFQSH